MHVVLDSEVLVSLGPAERQGGLLDDVTSFCDAVVPESSVYAVLHRERDRLFPDEMFTDLFSDRGRRSVPPSVVATVMVLQRLDGLSDREAVERYTFDARWRYAAGVGGYDTGGWGRFAHTVLVDMRARLAASADPRRIFNVTLQAASQAGLVGARRVLDSTPLYDAVATMDTITLIRSAIRGLLRVAEATLAVELRAAITSGDDYVSNAKPQIAWDDVDAREALVDSRARDAYACLGVLEGRQLDDAVADAAELLATVVGQDLDQSDDGTFRIARRVAADRVISTVDPEARHGHKTQARGFDGYKGHIAIDPDSEIITDTEVSAGNAGDGSAAADLIDDLTGEDTVTDDGTDGDGDATEPASRTRRRVGGRRRRPGGKKAGFARRAQARRAEARRAARQTRLERRRGRVAGKSGTVYGDAAYGTGEFLAHLSGHGIASRCKTQPPSPRPGGLFTKDRFQINLTDGTVTCPADITVTIRRGRAGDGTAYFAGACTNCALRTECTTATDGRTIGINRHEQRLAEARRDQKDPDWADDYRATRPKVERKLGHMMRRKHGGRRARVRGRSKVDADFNLLAAAQNLARLAMLRLHSTNTGWAVATP